MMAYPEALECQDSARGRLTAALDSPVHAYMFVGPTGSGKRQAARWFAGELFARAGVDDDADRHRRLAGAEHHPDLVVFERTGAAITAADARDVVRSTALSPVDAALKVLLLVDFQLVGAQTPIVLKAIEEPPPTTIFIVLATDVVPELVTIASRCVRIDFAAIPEAVIVDRLVASGAEPELAKAAARSAGGDLERARLLATDPLVEARLAAWSTAPPRLDGSGHAAASLAEELLAMVDTAAEPLKARHGEEMAQLEERVEHFGERGSGRSYLESRHKRELRRYRADELRMGLTALADTYRQRASSGDDIDLAAMIRAGDLVREAVEALPRNPTERLLLQSTLVRLPTLVP